MGEKGGGMKRYWFLDGILGTMNSDEHVWDDLRVAVDESVLGWHSLACQYVVSSDALFLDSLQLYAWTIQNIGPEPPAEHLTAHSADEILYCTEYTLKLFKESSAKPKYFGSYLASIKHGSGAWRYVEICDIIHQSNFRTCSTDITWNVPRFRCF